MSGIGGVRAFSDGTYVAHVLHEMTALLQHRGPDESAVWVGPYVGLAHTRLEVSNHEHARQPMHSADGR